jgi:large subunit ribosomal protein L6
MSRIGKKPIALPKGVKVTQDSNVIKVEGPKGTLTMGIPGNIEIAIEKETILVKRPSDAREDRSVHGLARTLLANMITGVSTGFEKGLEISGVGYRAEVTGTNLKMVLGYSNPVEYKIPKGIAVKVDKLVNIMVSGIDKQLVGRAAAEIRALRKPEPYKGKGIKYAGEHIRRKVGKSVGTK